MPRISVQLPEEDMAALREMAVDLHVPVPELIRRGVKRVLETGGLTREELIKRAMDTAGIGRSGRRDLAERHDDYFAESIQDW